MRKIISDDCTGLVDDDGVVIVIFMSSIRQSLLSPLYVNLNENQPKTHRSNGLLP